MKNLVKLIGALAIAFIFMTTPGETFAQNVDTVISDSETINNYSKKITRHPVVYPAYYHVPPSTYYYDLGGWKGTLNLVDWIHMGDQLLAYYSGTVHCSGPCVMNQ